MQRVSFVACGASLRVLISDLVRGGITGDFGERGRQHDELLSTMVEGTALSLLIVMLLMAAMFESLTQPLAVFVTFPLAFSGSAWAIRFTKGELDSIGFVCVINLIGVNNGIVLVDHISLLRTRGRDRRTAILDGCAGRIRPVLMGGLASSTIFTLIEPPVWYWLIGDARTALPHSVTLPVRWLTGVAGGGGA